MPRKLLKSSTVKPVKTTQAPAKKMQSNMEGYTVNKKTGKSTRIK